MASVNLSDLIIALTSAVTQAQDAVEQHQLALLQQNFDQLGRPVSLPVMLPDPSADSPATAAITLSVPKLSLMEPHLLHISEFSVEFDVSLDDLGQTPATAPAEPATPSPAPNSATGTSPASASGLFWAAAPGVRLGVPNIGPQAASDVAPAPADLPFAAAQPFASQSRQLSVGLGPTTPKGPIAKASIRVTSLPPSDGMVRLLTHLNKTF